MLKIDMILKTIDSDNYFSDIELQHITYSIKAIWNDLSKFAILMFFFLYTNNFIFYIFIFIFTTLLRVITGGIHLNTYFQCLIASSVYYSLIIFISSYIPSNYVMLLSIILSIITIAISPQLPSNSQRIICTSKNKIQCIAFVLHLALVLCYLFNSKFFRTIPYIVIINALQLIIMKGVKQMKAFKNKILLYKTLTLLLALAPVLVTKQSSAIFWGETKIPETLLSKNSSS